MKKHLPLLLSAIAGVITWLGIGIWSGRQEAWDSQLYWFVGFPFMILAVLIISFTWPEKPLRLGFTVIAAQAIIGLIQAYPHINLWPLTLVLFAVLSLPLILAAYLSSVTRKHINDKNIA